MRENIWWNHRFSKVHCWWNGFSFSPLILLSFKSLSRKPLVVKKWDHKHCHRWAPVTKWCNVKAQRHEACQIFIGDHATEETPWLLESCLARLREADVLTWQRLLVLAIVLVLEISPLFPLSQFFPIVMRIRSLNCCSWQTTHCLLRSQEWRPKLVMSTVLALYPSYPKPLPSPEPCNTMKT